MMSTMTRIEPEALKKKDVKPAKPTPAAGLFGRRSFGGSNAPLPRTREQQIAGVTKKW